MDKLRDALESFLESDRIIDSRLYREVYARDASYFDIKPLAIVRPHTTEQVQKLIDLCSRNNIGLTFRTGGTSLSGQTVNDGIICELRTTMNRYEIRDGGKKIWFEPGLTCQQVNEYLKPHHHAIGPDPASKSAAMMGGILANNSSGMSAGVRFNSYHTLSSIEFVLANGHRYNSGSPADRKRFEQDERDLCAGLMQIRQEILANEQMRNKIVRKYQIKNVTGYSMNAFVDFDNPMDIFAHVLIGSEGTLAYIASGELNTLPLMPVYSSTMLYFPTVTAAAAHAKWLGDSGARCVELMDYASLMSYLGKKCDLPKGTTVLLLDYGASSPEEMADITARMTPQLKDLANLYKMDPFTTTVEARADLWKMRNGIFPCVAGVRSPGATVILEDVVSQVADLAYLVDGVQKLFVKYDYDGAIFGHARDGNIHPLLTTPVDRPEQLDKFRHFMDDFVDHVVSLEGSLKGEHGTGRAIAPFVALEWGDEIYGLMKRLKKLADPGNVFNPGVIINDDPDCFLKPMKHMQLFGDKIGTPKADMCIECGYCEHVCPTRDITFTPRQRLQALRVISAHPGDKQLVKEYNFTGEQSCCSDGSCEMPCPMSISTAHVTDAIRALKIGKTFKATLTKSAEHYGDVESVVRGMLRMAVATEKVISPYPLIWATDFLHKISSKVPHWSKHFPMPAKLHYREVENPEYIYFPSCVTRIFGASSLGKDDLITVMLRVSDRAGLRMAVPKAVHGLCCSQIWDHKGDPEGKKISARKTVEVMYELSQGGKIPIMCDTSSCTHTLIRDVKDALSDENRKKYEALKIIDITEWLDTIVMPRLKVTKPKGKILLHPTCASKIIGVDGFMKSVAHKCAKEVVLPVNTHCCGAAGDRGFLFPKVAEAATRDEREEIAGESFDGCYSLARTCEISMMDTIARPYEGLIYLVDETTAAK